MPEKCFWTPLLLIIREKSTDFCIFCAKNRWITMTKNRQKQKKLRLYFCNIMRHNVKTESKIVGHKFVAKTIGMRWEYA